MAITLEELKRQREQIQKHLDWLDGKITDLELGDGTAGSSSAPASHEPIETTNGPNTEAPATGEPDQLVSTPVETTSKETTRQIPDIEAPTYKAQTQDELMRAKIGCFIFFILGTALFLFLLFGLPYLL